MSQTTPIISMFEIQIKNFIESKRPKDLEIRKQLDFGYSWDNKSAILFAVRPRWNNPDEFIQIPFAKLTYVKSKNIWKLFWQRANLKWEAYTPLPQSEVLDTLLQQIKQDSNGCFTIL